MMMTMSTKSLSLHLFFSALILSSALPARADLGTASQYSPPYSPTACFGDDGTKFPSNNLFAAAGEGVWDNGAACGRQYLVSCINAAQPGTCVEDQTVQVVVVDRASAAVSRPTVTGTTLVLSNTAYAAIANPATSSINVDYLQV